MITYRQIAPSDDLGAICVQMAPDKWAKDNEMAQYQEASLRTYLQDDAHILLLAYDNDVIAGAALCYVLLHPSGADHSLYVHELDTHPNYRRQGVAKGLMEELFAIAKQRGLNEVWLATEIDNDAANSLYKSLNPSEIEPSITYSYDVSKS